MELYDEHLRETLRLVEAARATKDPNAAIGLLDCAQSRIRAARSNAVIWADQHDVPVRGDVHYAEGQHPGEIKTTWE